MLQRGGLIIILAYLLVSIPRIQHLIEERQRLPVQLQLLLIFSLFAVISNFTGVEISGNEIITDHTFTQLAEDSSLSNTRVLTIGVSGMVGGPLVGIGVGLISGAVRFWQGGADPHTYLISSLLIGVFSGAYGQKFIRSNTLPSVKQGAIIGALMETVQMLCILLFGSHLAQALEVVRMVSLPMMLTNSIGTAMFLSIIHSVRRQEEQARAVQTHDVLQLANETLPYFRSGFDEESAIKAADIIRRFTKADAVSITDKQSILAFSGVASDHHKPTKEILTDLSKEVLRSGEIKEVHSHKEIGCHHPGCPLEAAIVIPLMTHGEIAGTLKFYFTDNMKLTFVERQWAEGLGNIFSNQLELGQAETEARLLRDAEIKSLQAQVNPHFLFNSLNTISALIRIDSEKARSLLVQMSHFFRLNLQGVRKNLLPLSQELKQVEAYRQLEQARFPKRVKMAVHIDEGLENVLIPPFLIQVLVENAFKHAFGNRKTGNEVKISVTEQETDYIVAVEDNGLGIPPEKLAQLGEQVVSSDSGTGSALENLNRRLVSLFGQESKLHFISNEEGTTVTSTIPITVEGE